MMMNDFGVPMSDAEMTMQAPGSWKPHEQMMAESGIGIDLDPGTAALIGGGISLLGGIMGRNEAKSQRRKEERFLERKYEEYDLPAWEMSRDRLIANRDEQIRAIQLQQSNELKLAQFKDRNNLRNYQQGLRIREFQIEQQNRLYEKAEGLYETGIRLNEQNALNALGRSREGAMIARRRNLEGAMTARERADLQFKETARKYAYENEDSIIESIIKKGELSVTSQSGKSAVKAGQSQMFDEGRQQAILVSSLVSAGLNTRMQLKDITQQYRDASADVDRQERYADQDIRQQWEAADIQAGARRMLRPEATPEPLRPLETPLADYELPRALEEFDFGPQPIEGVAMTPVPSMGSVIAGAVGAGFSAYSSASAGQNSFAPPTPGGSMDFTSPAIYQVQGPIQPLPSVAHHFTSPTVNYGGFNFFNP